jgi:hypothetical protein
MDYEEFLRHRRRRMADIIRVAFRQLGGESDAPPVTPPWFLPGAEAVWQRIAETERALRGVIRQVYVARFGDAAASRIEGAVPEGDRPTLARNLARRPPGADPLSIVDYLYLGQLPNMLFTPDVQQEARTSLPENKTRSSDSWRLSAKSHRFVTRSPTSARSIATGSFARALPAPTFWRC